MSEYSSTQGDLHETRRPPDVRWMKQSQVRTWTIAPVQVSTHVAHPPLLEVIGMSTAARVCEKWDVQMHEAQAQTNDCTEEPWYLEALSLMPTRLRNRPSESRSQW